MEFAARIRNAWGVTLLSFLLCIAAYAECTRDLPPIGTSDDNFIGPNKGSVAGSGGRTATDMKYRIANYLFFEQGEAFRYHELEPDLIDFIQLDVEGIYVGSSDIFETAICNERGECGTATVSANWGGDEVGLPVISIGDLFTIDVPMQVGVIATSYSISVEFLGAVSTSIFDAEFVRDEISNAAVDPNYDPRFPMPSVENPNPGDDDLRCRDSYGNLTGEGEGQGNANGGSYNETDYYDHWEDWHNDWEEGYGGQTPQYDCWGDFSDPNNTGVVCSWN